MRKYYCDRCGAEVGTPKDLQDMRIKKRPPEFGTVYELCEKCFDEFSKWVHTKELDKAEVEPQESGYKWRYSDE